MKKTKELVEYNFKDFTAPYDYELLFGKSTNFSLDYEEKVTFSQDYGDYRLKSDTSLNYYKLMEFIGAPIIHDKKNVSIKKFETQIKEYLNNEYFFYNNVLHRIAEDQDYEGVKIEKIENIKEVVEEEKTPKHNPANFKKIFEINHKTISKKEDLIQFISKFKSNHLDEYTVLAGDPKSPYTEKIQENKKEFWPYNIDVTYDIDAKVARNFFQESNLKRTSLGYMVIQNVPNEVNFLKKGDRIISYYYNKKATYLIDEPEYTEKYTEEDYSNMSKPNVCFGIIRYQDEVIGPNIDLGPAINYDEDLNIWTLDF